VTESMYACSISLSDSALVQSACTDETREARPRRDSCIVKISLLPAGGLGREEDEQECMRKRDRKTHLTNACFSRMSFAETSVSAV
jgi:hypothetical protein